MGDPNGAVSITNTSVTIVDHYTGYCRQRSDPFPSGQGKAVIRLECDYNRNRDIMDVNRNECNPMTRTTQPTAQPTVQPRVKPRVQPSVQPRVQPTAPNCRDRESQFTTDSTSGANTGSASIDRNGNALHVGRGKHRLKQKKSATRADRSEYMCATLAAQVVPPQAVQSSVVPQVVPVSDSAFDNKAFSCDSTDGHSVLPELKTQTQNNTSCLQTNISLNSNHTLFEINSEDCSQLSAHTLTQRLINNENNNNCVKSGSKQKNYFMKTNNESESTLKGQQYCSSGPIDRQIRRSRSTRSVRSSVVKHIGVFYSDLCDVIKDMRSGTQSNSNSNNRTSTIIRIIANNGNNSTSNSSNAIITSTVQSEPTQPQQTSASNARTNISGQVLLQSSNTTVVSTQPPEQTSVPYPIQPQIQAITCLKSSPSQLIAVNTTLRRDGQTCQTQIRVNETPVPDLPDILNAHLPPPPYSTLPPPGQQLPHLSLPPLVERGRHTPIRAPPPPPPPPPLPVAGRPPLPSRRILHTPTAVLTHCSRPNYLRPTCAVSETETSASKTCLTCNGVSIRWFILLIAFIGLLCAIIGTILGALRTTGREHLTLALLMIGVGIILITVSGIAWRLTSSGPTWRSILGLQELHPQHSLCNGSALNDNSRRFVPRVPAPYGRTGSHHHPYGAMFYPEFQYRPPPPSYQASMQEYRLRLLLLDRSSSHPQSTSLSPVSPPPTYRSSTTSTISRVQSETIPVQTTNR